MFVSSVLSYLVLVCPSVLVRPLVPFGRPRELPLTCRLRTVVAGPLVPGPSPAYYLLRIQQRLVVALFAPSSLGRDPGCGKHVLGQALR